MTYHTIQSDITSSLCLLSWGKVNRFLKIVRTIFARTIFLCNWEVPNATRRQIWQLVELLFIYLYLEFTINSGDVWVMRHAIRPSVYDQGTVRRQATTPQNPRSGPAWGYFSSGRPEVIRRCLLWL